MFLRWGRARILHGFGSHAVRCPISWDTHVDWSEVELGSFLHVLAGGHVMRSVGHFRPVASQEFVLRTDESVTGSDCGPSSIKTDATILTLFPAPALSRKFPALPTTQHSRTRKSDRNWSLTPQAPVPFAIPSHLSTFSIRTSTTIATVQDSPRYLRLPPTPQPEAWHYGAATMDNGQDPRPHVFKN
ncbi:hypothetical protein EDB86DRAFT_2825152 [Lactarius hatsudake]|nr:hypothetical protein EDB86DRAFT_2825152 [Lactarius hatsudake]